jgi:G1/S-specific cyclin PLC1
MVSRPRVFTTRVWDQFLQSSVSPEMICYLAQKVSDVVERNPFNQHPIGTLDQVSKVITANQQLEDNIPALETFISGVVRQSNVQVPILMTTLLYLSRLRSKLTPSAKGLRSTPHRIFLACLILSEKFLDDCSLYNKDWALYSQFGGFSFNNQEVNVMEKQLLFQLDWNLNFEPCELERHLEPFLIRIRDLPARIRSIDYRGNRRALNKSRPRGKFQSSNINTKTSKTDIKTEGKTAFSFKRKNFAHTSKPSSGYGTV